MDWSAPIGGRTASATCCSTFLRNTSSSPSRASAARRSSWPTKQLCKIRDLSPFDRNYTLQAALGTHVVPVDQTMTNAAIWLGLAAPGETPEQAAETLKSAVRKADVPVFAHYLRCLAVDPRLVKAFEPGKGSPPAADPQTMAERLEVLFKECDSAARKSGKKPTPGRGAVRAAEGRDRAGGAKARPRDSRGTSSVRKKR